MVLATLILTNLIWILYSLTEGVREGFYWHYENISKRVCSFDINRIYILQRSAILVIFSGFLVHTLGWYSLISIFCMVLMFSFFHNGTYYYTRNKLQPGLYTKGWSDESRTFPPFFTGLCKYNRRILGMLIGLSTQIFVYLFLLN